MYEKEILSLDDVKRVTQAAETEALRNNRNVVIGISGVKSHEDGQIAQAGVDAL